MKKILIYSHDTYGLGNIRRMLAIAEHLANTRSDYSILILSGSPMLHSFRIPERIDYVKLPCLGRTVGGKYVVRSLDMAYEAIVQLRANIIHTTLLDYQPDLILVDKKPLGLSNELEQALMASEQLPKRPKCALVLRDILDAPATTRAEWEAGAYHRAIEQYYDQVLVVGAAEVFNLADEYGFPSATRSKLRYCGYVHRQPGLRSAEAVRKELGIGTQQPMLLLTAGGGADGFALLAAYLRGPAQQAPAADLHSVVLCGPEMMAAHRQQIDRWAQQCRNITVLEFSDDPLSLMGAADIVVSMGGYNTVCEILSLGKRAIIVPRVEPVEEQWIRCQRMAELGIITALHPSDLSSVSLSHAITERLREIDQGEVADCRLPFDGLGRLGGLVDQLLSESTMVAREAVGQSDSSAVPSHRSNTSLPFLFPNGLEMNGGWRYGTAS